MKQHRLVSYSHECDHLNSFESSIDDIHIVQLNDANRVKSAQIHEEKKENEDIEQQKSVSIQIDDKTTYNITNIPRKVYFNDTFIPSNIPMEASENIFDWIKANQNENVDGIIDE
eukprot:208365_1